eukprot:1488049-Pleurochrysis_carterae.AAC.2
MDARVGPRIQSQAGTQPSMIAKGERSHPITSARTRTTFDFFNETLQVHQNQVFGDDLFTNPRRVHAARAVTFCLIYRLQRRESARAHARNRRACMHARSTHKVVQEPPHSLVFILLFLEGLGSLVQELCCLATKARLGT